MSTYLLKSALEKDGWKVEQGGGNVSVTKEGRAFGGRLVGPEGDPVISRADLGEKTAE
jgi:hypothetical protein